MKPLIKSYDLSIVLSKSRNTIWDILPVEIIENIYFLWCDLVQTDIRNAIQLCSDEDLYKEVHRRNCDCFSAHDNNHIDMYNILMEKLGMVDIIGPEHDLVYTNDEINSASMMTNHSIQSNLHMVDYIVRFDYYTLNDVFDAITSMIAIQQGADDNDEDDIRVIANWNTLELDEKKDVVVRLFNKIKGQFIDAEPIVSNCAKFGSLRYASYAILKREES